MLKVFTGQEKSIEMPKAKAFHICPIRITANISAFQAEDVGSIPTQGFRIKDGLGNQNKRKDNEI